MASKGSVLTIAVCFLFAGFSSAQEELAATTEEFAATTEPTTPSPGSRPCPAIEGIAETCVCNHGGKIDLTALSNSDETPRFTGFADSEGFTYNYNPCTPFKSKLCGKKEDDDTVFGCQVSSDGKSGYLVADAGTEEMWIDGDGTVFLYYSGSDKRKTKVSLRCDQEAINASITTSGDTIVELTYLFDITSCHVCPGGCHATGSKTAFDRVGIIGIVIILLVIGVLLTYFIAGAVIMKVHYQAEGSDIIPNKNVWFQLPLLVKEGCLFTFVPPVRFIKAKVKGEEYQKM